VRSENPPYCAKKVSVSTPGKSAVVLPLTAFSGTRRDHRASSANTFFASQLGVSFIDAAKSLLLLSHKKILFQHNVLATLRYLEVSARVPAGHELYAINAASNHLIVLRQAKLAFGRTMYG